MKIGIGMSIRNPEGSSDSRARIMPSIALGMQFATRKAVQGQGSCPPSRGAREYSPPCLHL